MKTTIRNSILAITVLLYISVSAQSNVEAKKGIADEMMKCSYIFEGKIISSKSYVLKTNEEIKGYTSYLMEVDKVIKGTISKGTVNILIPNGISYDGHISVPNEGLYCCYADSPVKDSSIVNTNSKSLEYYCGDSMSNGELKKDNNDNLIIYFPSIADFYTYISANYGINIDNNK